MVAVVLMVWVLSLLTDPETRWRRTGLEAPVIGFLVVVLLSVAINIGRVNALGISSEVLKHVSFFLSFVLIMYFVASVITGHRQIDAIIMLLVGGGTVVALLSIIEWRTGYNAFNHLHIPGLRLDPSAAAGPPERGMRTRAYGSAQHPIALAQRSCCCSRWPSICSAGPATGPGWAAPRRSRWARSPPSRARPR